MKPTEVLRIILIISTIILAILCISGLIKTMDNISIHSDKIKDETNQFCINNNMIYYRGYCYDNNTQKLYGVINIDGKYHLVNGDEHKILEVGN